MQRAEGFLQLALQRDARSLACPSRSPRRTILFNRPQRIHYGVELYRLAARRRHPLQSERRLVGANARKPTGQNRAFFTDAQTWVSDDFERVRKHPLGRQQRFEFGRAIPRFTMTTRAWRAAWPACHEWRSGRWRPRTPAEHHVGPEVPTFKKFLPRGLCCAARRTTSFAFSRCKGQARPEPIRHWAPAPKWYLTGPGTHVALAA